MHKSTTYQSVESQTSQCLTLGRYLLIIIDQYLWTILEIISLSLVLLLDANGVDCVTIDIIIYSVWEPVLSWRSILSNVMVWKFLYQCQFSQFSILLFATHFFLSCPSYKISFFSSLCLGLSSLREKLSWIVFFWFKLVFRDSDQNQQYALDIVLIPQYTHRYTAATKYSITVSATEKGLGLAQHYQEQ